MFTCAGLHCTCPGTLESKRWIWAEKWRNLPHRAGTHGKAAKSSTDFLPNLKSPSCDGVYQGVITAPLKVNGNKIEQGHCGKQRTQFWLFLIGSGLWCLRPWLSSVGRIMKELRSSWQQSDDEWDRCAHRGQARGGSGSNGTNWPVGKLFLAGAKFETCSEGSTCEAVIEPWRWSSSVTLFPLKHWSWKELKPAGELSKLHRTAAALSTNALKCCQNGDKMLPF